LSRSTALSRPHAPDVLQLLATVYGGDTGAALGLGSGSEFTLVSTLGVLVSHENSSKRQISCLHRPYNPPLPLLRAPAGPMSPFFRVLNSPHRETPKNVIKKIEKTPVFDFFVDFFEKLFDTIFL
jgi:hypothetical protein